MNEIVNAINGVIWSPALIYLCLGVGLYFSLRSRFLQLRHLKGMIRLMFQGKGNDAGVSSFQALSMTLAGRVGTGNIAGVATAITFGGPGALFWMWMVAFLGASSAFVESTLGQVYKEKINGEYRGGPAFYIEKGLGMKWYAWTFAISTIFACGVLMPGVQANSIGSSLQTAFDIDPNVTAAGLALLLGFIIFGGVKRIANFASTVVPFMALGYIIVACVIIALNIGQLPGVILLIWKSAFGLDAGFGAILGLAIMWGVKRGVYSNEAGQGTGPHASSAAAVSHPAKQGLVQAFSVYVDTLFVCSAIAVLTTLGIIASLAFDSFRFFQKVPVLDFLFGTQWSPQIAIRADQVGSSGAFGAVPLFAGTFLVMRQMARTSPLLPVDLLPAMWHVAGPAMGYPDYLRVVPTADLSTTLGLSVSVLLMCLFYNIKIKGIGGWTHELVTAPFGTSKNPVWALLLGVINFLMQMIEFVAKTVSHGMRLFGNMFAGELVFMLIALLGGFASLSLGGGLFFVGHVIAGTVWTLFHILVITLQAFIFMMLALIYLGQAHDAH